MSIVILHVSCSTAKVGSERRFEKGLTILALKGKLELITGALAGHMKLVLRTPEDRDICVLDNNDAMLGAYPVEDHLHLHVSFGALQHSTNVERGCRRREGHGVCV